MALRVCVVAPAGPVDPGRLAAGCDFLRRRGLQVRIGAAAARVWGHLAGSDEERAADLNQALLDPGTDLVWAARGGFGGLRLLRLLDWEGLAARREPRPPLIGYSDLTSLQNALRSRLDWPCWHAPMVAVELAEGQDALSTASLNAMLNALAAGDKAGPAPAVAARRDAGGLWRLCPPAELTDAAALVVLQSAGYRLELGLEARQVWRGGRVEGGLAGGNLSVLTSLLGGPGQPRLASACLLLEDHGEYPFRLDRHLAQLDNAGALGAASALLLGHVRNCEEPDPAKSTFTAEALLRSYADRVPGPVLSGLPFGHAAPRICIPLHGRCLIRA